MGCRALLQGTFLTQGSKLHLLCLLHWQMGSLSQALPGKHPLPLETTNFFSVPMSLLTVGFFVFLLQILRLYICLSLSDFFFFSSSCLLLYFALFVGCPLGPLLWFCFPVCVLVSLAFHWLIWFLFPLLSGPLSSTFFSLDCFGFVCVCSIVPVIISLILHLSFVMQTR